MNERSVLAYCRKYGMLPADALVLAAVSGGRDSMCMLHALHALSVRVPFRLEAVHYNHHLRGAQSDEDARFTEEACRALGVPCRTGGGDVAARAAAEGRGTEETARAMRYAFFRETARETGAARVATAHTADDNAETVLLNLARGSGAKGLAGIPPVRGLYIRPLLNVPRREVDAYAAENGVAYRDDPTNFTDDYARNRVRLHAVPVLKGVNPDFCGAVTDMTELVREDDAYLASLAEAFVRDCCPGGRCPAAALAALPRPVASRAVRLLFGPALSRAQTEAVLTLAAGSSPSAACDASGVRVRREYEWLTAEPVPSGFAPVALHPGETVALPGTGLRVSCETAEKKQFINKSFTTFLLKCDRIYGNISIRPRRPGDTIRPAGRGCTKTLHRLLMEQRVPAARRDLIPVVADARGVLAVYGAAVDERAVSGDGPVLKITFEENM